MRRGSGFITKLFNVQSFRRCLLELRSRSRSVTQSEDGNVLTIHELFVLKMSPALHMTRTSFHVQLFAPVCFDHLLLMPEGVAGASEVCKTWLGKVWFCHIFLDTVEVVFIQSALRHFLKRHFLHRSPRQALAGQREMDELFITVTSEIIRDEALPLNDDVLFQREVLQSKEEVFLTIAHVLNPCPDTLRVLNCVFAQTSTNSRLFLFHSRYENLHSARIVELIKVALIQLTDEKSFQAYFSAPSSSRPASVFIGALTWLDKCEAVLHLLVMQKVSDLHNNFEQTFCFWRW